MKCPKCAYVGFEVADRCRHCGYEFSLIDPGPAAAAEAALARPEAVPLEDLPLSAPVSVVASALFDDPQPPPARTPLAVRRTTERPRSRATPPVPRRPRQTLLETGSEAGPAEAPAPAGETAPVAAPALPRVASALIDLALLATIDLAVVYLTTQMAGVPVADAATLPLVPLCAFVLGLNVAYVAVFTANGGQTLGKMAMGLRVEATDDGPLTFGSAVVRVVVGIAGGLVMGAGLVPALWRADRRAVHDQLANTRVVKVSA